MTFRPPKALVNLARTLVRHGKWLDHIEQQGRRRFMWHTGKGILPIVARTMPKAAKEGRRADLVTESLIAPNQIKWQTSWLKFIHQKADYM